MEDPVFGCAQMPLIAERIVALSMDLRYRRAPSSQTENQHERKIASTRWLATAHRSRAHRPALARGVRIDATRAYLEPGCCEAGHFQRRARRCQSLRRGGIELGTYP